MLYIELGYDQKQAPYLMILFTTPIFLQQIYPTNHCSTYIDLEGGPLRPETTVLCLDSYFCHFKRLLCAPLTS